MIAEPLRTLFWVSAQRTRTHAHPGIVCALAHPYLSAFSCGRGERHIVDLIDAFRDDDQVVLVLKYVRHDDFKVRPSFAQVWRTTCTIITP